MKKSSSFDYDVKKGLFKMEICRWSTLEEIWFRLSIQVVCELAGYAHLKSLFGRIQGVIVMWLDIVLGLFIEPC